jgi:hypothetical protein
VNPNSELVIICYNYRFQFQFFMVDSSNFMLKVQWMEFCYMILRVLISFNQGEYILYSTTCHFLQPRLVVALMVPNVVFDFGMFIISCLQVPSIYRGMHRTNGMAASKEFPQCLHRNYFSKTNQIFKIICCQASNVNMHNM